MRLEQRVKELITKRGNLENAKKKEFTTRSPSTWLRFARGAEDTERDFPEDIAGSLKGPSQSEGSRCSASRPMWRVLGDKISSLIFFPKTSPHKALTRSIRLPLSNSTHLIKLEVTEPSACRAIALATAGVSVVSFFISWFRLFVLS
jgi:hypothetical protein